MIKQIEDLPGNVVGFVYSGQVTSEEYDAVIVPALKKEVKDNQKIRVIVQFNDDFTNVTMKAAMEDAFLGLKYYGDWERVALVSNHEGWNHAIKAISFLVPGELRIFPLSEYDVALAWITSDHK